MKLVVRSTIRYCWKKMPIITLDMLIQVESEDTLATIIDFSLSRAEVESKLAFL